MAPEIQRSDNVTFLIAACRGVAGALLFALPLLMTMEMWAMGFYVAPARLAVLTAATLPLLYGLSYFVGFEDTPRPLDNLLDACAAYGIGFLTSAAMLATFAVIIPGGSLDETIGKLALQAVPGSIGALLAQSQLGPVTGEERERRRRAGYFGGLFFMAVGALFLAFNVAPTEEVVLLAQKMTPAHALAAALLSLTIMHAFVYGVEFSGAPEEPPGTPWWNLFVRYSVAGYAVVLIVGAALLWVFGRTDGLAPAEVVTSTVVLGVPAAVGAAAARLIL